MLQIRVCKCVLQFKEISPLSLDKKTPKGCVFGPDSSIGIEDSLIPLMHNVSK